MGTEGFDASRRPRDREAAKAGVPTRKRGNEQLPFGFRQPLGWTAVLWLVLLAGGAAVAQESADPEAARAAAEERLREAETRAEAALADRAADEPSDRAAAQTQKPLRPERHDEKRHRGDGDHQPPALDQQVE